MEVPGSKQLHRSTNLSDMQGKRGRRPHQAETASRSRLEHYPQGENRVQNAVKNIRSMLGRKNRVKAEAAKAAGLKPRAFRPAITRKNHFRGRMPGMRCTWQVHVTTVTVPGHGSVYVVVAMVHEACHTLTQGKPFNGCTEIDHLIGNDCQRVKIPVNSSIPAYASVC